MRTWILVFFILITSFFVTPASAEKSLHFPGGNFSSLRKGDSGHVSQVIDPLTIAMDDKRIIRLSGIDIPDNNPYKPGNFAVTAQKILQDMLIKKSINIYQVQKNGWGQSNRMGQQLGHLERQADNAWVQGTLLELGLARVMTDSRTPEMAQQMYELEHKARAEGMGLWSRDEYKILTPAQAAEKIGTVQIVEGVVQTVTTKQNRIYLNFGSDWRNDFTITIQPEGRKIFYERKIDPLKWGKKKIRVRGWIGDYNGPYIEADHPERIEVID